MPWTKTQYCQDLVKFAEIVCRYDDSECISNGLGVLHTIAYQFEYSGSALLEIEGVELRIHKKTAGTTPSEVQSLSINIDCLCDVNLDLDASEYDVISQYGLQLEIVGYVGDKAYINCWHLDKDIPPQEGDVHNHTHPSYHFQAGGHRVEGLDTGSLLLLGAPRLPHPPMDIFLTIHFVISNFFGKRDFPFVDDLFNDPDYQDILQRAKERMFTPYFQAFGVNCTHQDFNVEKIFPLAV
ncbi:hypothetical protein CWO27_21000 [Vibrio sp. 10N.286.51.C3]|uniref:hypothetical protein n=1 Tax=unclassified Vibrio TaxID=2614977 RepID=UPI000D343345|nr:MULTISPECIES: hypothetical protein [unclassified Vibrio]PTP12093.1 hypothetical protein CWO27_21000 [Vibrio sp. 10N.286.51.C3]TKE65865.1 hypothetical protein FCV45_11375 [Vibrio sp. F12]